MPREELPAQESGHPALEQPTRRRIYRRIGEKPGMNWNQLRRSLGVSTGVLSHHLDRLEDEKLIVRLEGESGRGEIIHFQAKDAELGQDERTRVLFGHPSTRRVAMLILEHPEITRKQLAKKLDISVPSVGYHLDKLRDKDLIRETSGDDEEDEGGGGRRAHTYEAAEHLEAWGEEVGHAFGLM